ncbi:hypothetical protein CWI80_02610 [Pseudidiomarina sediminum]|uniref:LPS-assembly lipoprotein LptE n=1 Tax=Pseudidiomarina sediminum TaxID=431675 RepID=A0A432Z8M8_9GAMM|nr:LPS assembly lipoprotein LptE [Pseudidiomarina sediminum]MBY6063425.1 hypothetical protein [Pseudidiomarina sediminum]RUO74256.1 hypothetical protein CWI80_02610 [Pseudidiomarina sediminum]
MRQLIIGLCLLSLTACGFQLRGDYQLPPSLQQVVISAPQFSEFAEHAKQRFELAGAEVLSSGTGLTQLEILNDDLSRRTLSLSASGQVAEYELIYHVSYILIQASGERRPMQLEVFRDYQDDPNFALAKTREREVLVAEMREQAAQRLVRQVIATLGE